MADLLHKDDPVRISDIIKLLTNNFSKDKKFYKNYLSKSAIQLISTRIYSSMIQRIPLSDFNLKDQDTIQKINKFEKKLENLVRSSNEIHDFIFNHSKGLDGDLSFRFNSIVDELKQNIEDYKTKTENELSTKGSTDLIALQLVDAFMKQYSVIQQLYPPTKAPKEISEGGMIANILIDLFKVYKLFKSDEGEGKVISVYRRWYKLKGYRH